MNNQRGMTLIETMLVVSAAALLIVATAAYSIPWLARESMRGAIYDVQTYLQLSRIEAVSRNRECRMVLNTTSRTLQIFDSNATVSTTDDTELYTRALPSSVTFARPDMGLPLTLSQIGSTGSYQVVFDSDGTVTSGTGDVYIFGGDRFGRISVFAAGGTQVERWNGVSWEIGS
jgi:prepilin-type N-terminal cleavage/methylation domain-containing protein